MIGAGSAEPALMLLYDGDCGYCNGWVWWLLRHDAGGSLCFAMLQGAHGAAFLERVPALARLDSIILVEGTGEATRVYVRSDASIRLARYLGVPWSLFALVVVIPRPLRDAFAFPLTLGNRPARVACVVARASRTLASAAWRV